jgi:hypothetical protein
MTAVADATTPEQHSAQVKAKQDIERKATREKAATKATPKTGGTSKATKVAGTPKRVAKDAPKFKSEAGAPSKADRVRALLDAGKSVREVADALKDQGITWSYAWDVAAAYEKKTGKVFIASHGAPKATAPKATTSRVTTQTPAKRTRRTPEEKVADGRAKAAKHRAAKASTDATPAA